MTDDAKTALIENRDDDTGGATGVKAVSTDTPVAATGKEKSDPESVPADEDERSEPYPVDIGQVFEILKNERRRAVLRYMRTTDGETQLGELAEQIAAWECDKEVRQITSGERKRVYVGLYQSHLPKMDDVSAVSYNKSRGKIEPGVNRHIFEQYLPDEDASAGEGWTDYHLGLSIIAGCLVCTLVLLGTATSAAPVQLVVAGLLGALVGLPFLALRE